MKKLKVLLGTLLSLVLLAACPIAHESVIWTITSGASTATIQSTINGASAGDAVQFNAATYNITSAITLKCGITYTATTPAPTSNVILHGAFTRESAIIFNLYSGSGYANPCTQATTISYLDFDNAAGIYVQTSFTNVTITHDQFTNLPCCANQLYDTALFFDGSSASNNTTQILSSATVTWNTFGDANSCETPSTGNMENVGQYADTTYSAGGCAAMRVNGSVNGLLFEYNKMVHIGEGVAWGCPNFGGTMKYACEPSSTGPQVGSGATTKNVTAMYNDFAGVHRIAWEEQPQQTSGVIFQYNSLHDAYYPYFGNFDLSFACCENGATAPYLVVNNNVLIANTANSACPSYTGYGIEAHGTQASYSNNMVQGNNGSGGSCPKSVPGIAWGFGANPRNYNNNYVCGPNFAPNYIVTESGGYPTPSSIAGNVEATSCSALTSVAPTLPPSGYLIGPITVTDPGYTSGAQPLGNTSIYCTTDGSTPTVSSPLYTGPLAVSYPVTVKCIGMWGSGGNAASYPSGYGFVPSAVVSASYTSAAAAATPVLTPGSTSYATSLSISISDATPGATINYTTDGSTPTTSSTLYSGPFTISGATVVKAIATKSGYSQSATATGTYTSTTVVSTPTFSPASSSFSSSVTVSISDLTSSSTIYYTTDGSTPGTTGGGIVGTTYYLSPSGSDSNSGTSSGSPWLSPNHSLNCGDTILAASGTYSASNFGSSSWGTVSCASGNSVAWLKCATFDTCKISSTSSDGMWVNKSFWGIQGWEVTTSTYIYGACFHAGPTGGSTIHHIIFANNVANGCMGGGFNSYEASTSASVDYIVYVGNVAYAAAAGSGACYSGFNVFQPIASDSNAGTHMYMAGNFSYSNFDASPCSGGLTTDGEGFNFDTFDFSQGGGPAYTQQAVIENNIAVGNGSSGVLMENNKTGTSSAPTFFRYNTTYGNLAATNRSFCLGLGELYAEAAYTVTATNNLAMTNAATGCSGDDIYAAAVNNGSSSDVFQNNWLYSAAGHTTFTSSSGSFAFGTNVTTTNPAFTSTTIPGAPSCSGAANVPACMATLIANFTPTAPGASTYGYQPPSPTAISNPYFPAWLCTANLPAGLVSMPCGQVYTSPLTLSSTTTVKAIATASGLTTSAVGSATYTLTGGGGGPTATATPTATPVGGTYFATQSVTLSDTTSGATIYYTTDGSTPTAGSTTYLGAISVSSSDTIKAIGITPGLTDSPVASFSYLISAPTPSQRGNIDYTQIKSAERLGPGNFFQMANVGAYSAVNTATPCNTTNQGATAFVLDSTTAAYGASISGGGSNKVHALCNGTAWVVD